MRLTGYLLPLLAANFALLAALAPEPVLAQQGNLYRAEIIVLERRIDPDQVEEKMASRRPDPVPELDQKLWVMDQDGAVESTLDLVPRERLHLNSAAQRLEQSGRYRVLVAAAWRESFPPDYKGQRLQVAAGDWLPEAGQREVEGYISIDRQRFLHVTAALNHWQAHPEAGSQKPDPDAGLNTGDAPARSMGSQDAQGQGDSRDIETLDLAAEPQSTPALELITWIRETRRMRSEEIHFLDSPTIGVLVFFKRLEGVDAPGGSQSAPE
ncbi:CsiV family protein [Marinobacter salicampi]|uniref:CsiV family protein n=1 Tax=Marinobacter salicampi TaxID=435907 RepID=UPI001F5FABF2|nr:CsiV family protein [Marinobacter salicampi]